MGGHGQRRADVLDHHLLFAAEAAADPGLDHADPADGQTQRPGQLAAQVKRHLGATNDHQPLVLIEIRDGRMQLHLGVLHPLRIIAVLQHQLRLGEAGLHVAHLHIHAGADVALRVFDVDDVRLVMNHWSTCF